MCVLEAIIGLLTELVIAFVSILPGIAIVSITSVSWHEILTDSVSVI